MIEKTSRGSNEEGMNRSRMDVVGKGRGKVKRKEDFLKVECSIYEDNDNNSRWKERGMILLNLYKVSK